MKQGLSWPAQAAEQRAIGLLDTAVAEGVPWRSVGEAVCAQLEEAELGGLAALARLRLGASAQAVGAAAPASASPAVVQPEPEPEPEPEPVPEPELVLRGGLSEKVESWADYAQLCVKAFGEDDERAVEAQRRAAAVRGAWEGQQALERSGVGEADVVAAIFQHFVEVAADDGAAADADGARDAAGAGAGAGGGRGLGFTRHLRAAVAVGDPQPDSPCLGRDGYTAFLLALGYQDCDDSRWRLECEALGAPQSTGPTFAQFRLLFSLHGRDAWQDAQSIFGDGFWREVVGQYP
eukprot:COSAG04_NODE_1055_length_8548_cov_3.532970_6_plen_293_part_00